MALTSGERTGPHHRLGVFSNGAVARPGEAANFGRTLGEGDRSGQTHVGQLMCGALQFADGTAGPAGDGEADDGAVRATRPPSASSSHTWWTRSCTVRVGTVSRTAPCWTAPCRTGAATDRYCTPPFVQVRTSTVAAPRSASAIPGWEAGSRDFSSDRVRGGEQPAGGVDDHHLAADAPGAVGGATRQVLIGTARVHGQRGVRGHRLGLVLRCCSRMHSGCWSSPPWARCRLWGGGLIPS